MEALPEKAINPIKSSGSASIRSYAANLARLNLFGVKSSASMLREASMPSITVLPLLKLSCSSNPHCGLAIAMRIKEKANDKKISFMTFVFLLLP